MLGKKSKKLLTYVALLAMIVVNVLGNGMVSKASETGQQPFKVTASMSSVEIKAGETKSVSIPVQLSGVYVSGYPLRDVEFIIDTGDKLVTVTSDIVLRQDGTSNSTDKMYTNYKYFLEFDLTADELASNGI